MYEHKSLDQIVAEIEETQNFDDSFEYMDMDEECINIDDDNDLDELFPRYAE